MVGRSREQTIMCLQSPCLSQISVSPKSLSHNSLFLPYLYLSGICPSHVLVSPSLWLFGLCFSHVSIKSFSFSISCLPNSLPSACLSQVSVSSKFLFSQRYVYPNSLPFFQTSASPHNITSVPIRGNRERTVLAKSYMKQTAARAHSLRTLSLNCSAIA